MRLASASQSQSQKVQREQTRSGSSSLVRIGGFDDSEDEKNGDSDSDVGGIHFESKVIDLSDEGDNEESPRRPVKGKRRTCLAVAESCEKDHNSTMDADESQDIVVPVHWTSKRRGKRGLVDDSDAEEELQPRKRKLVKGVRPPSPADEDDILDEIDEDREPIFQVHQFADTRRSAQK